MFHYFYQIHCVGRSSSEPSLCFSVYAAFCYSRYYLLCAFADNLSGIVVFQYKDAFMKANPGYKWCPATNKPVKSPCHTVSNARKKVWSFPSNSPKGCATAKKVPKTDSTPQLNFAMAGASSFYFWGKKLIKYVSCLGIAATK